MDAKRPHFVQPWFRLKGQGFNPGRFAGKTRERHMSIKKILLSACAAVTLLTGAASAQPGWVPPGNDRDGYYSDNDHNGYYDRDGRYRRIRDRGGRYDRDY